ncbi:ABC transporter permease [Kineosporia sp. NBRC 101677]|uniref:carbohydrate ABC transporter permease n=1 Tax=Kineosporia sp. NBRC 101677 TaxID=3032197 RepID=UPI0024A14336|nr:sugar ABC transporter permease [Kineosporia sp. NBRC 101677]GLY18928.1 ABC transporter permease [Kineosporia sp. NBRC 101677]
MNDVLGDKRAIALLVGPALLVYSLVMVVPILWSTGYTLFEGSVIRGFTFHGLGNFRTLADDGVLWDALVFTVKYAVVTTLLQVALGYLLAVAYVFWFRRSSGIVRTLLFFPVILPTVAVGLLFQRVFESAPSTGPVNAVLDAVGVGAVDWFGSPTQAFVVIVAMDLWRSMGFYAVLLYAGLLDIPQDVLESASLDGARGLGMLRHIILPLSLPVLLSSVIFSINGTLKVFDSVLALTNGGPGQATTPLTLYMYQTSFTYGDYGYGSTIALTLSALCLLVTVFVFRSSRRDLKE